MSDQTPRINAPLLSQFMGRTVRIIGKVTEQQGNKAIIDANGFINLNLTMVFAPSVSRVRRDSLTSATARPADCWKRRRVDWKGAAQHGGQGYDFVGSWRPRG